MSDDDGSSFPSPSFPPPAPHGDPFTPTPIVTEPRSFFTRRIAKLPLWAWLAIDALVIVGIVAVVTARNDGDDVESVSPSTRPATSAAPATSAQVPTTAPGSPAAPISPPTTAAVATTAPVPVTTVPPATAPPTSPATTVPPASTAPPSGPSETPPPLPGFGDGMQLVGRDLEPGRYTATGFEFCYWERLSGLSGELDDVIANDIPNTRAIVEIVPTDVAFDSVDCGDWTLYFPSVAVATFTDGDWVVGQDILPGQYTAESTGDACYWERASGFTHDPEEIIANDIPRGRAIVEVEQSDVRFSSRGCGTWTPL